MPADTLRGLYERGRARLDGCPDAAADAKVLLLRAARVPETRFLASPDAPVAARRAELFLRWIERRRAGVPAAQLTGTREFWSLPFRVTRSVLIPRPETETLVETVLALAETGRETIVDVGTGSGCIAVALARELPRARVLAVDVSARALAVARRNALALGCPGIEFSRGNLLSPFRGSGLRFDIVVSNPPYVSRAEWDALPGEVRAREPRRALWGGEDGLDVVRRLARQAKSRLRPGGYLVLEIGSGQADSALAAFGRGWREIETGLDLAGRPRVLTARRA